MGLLTPRGEEDEEDQGEISIAGLDDLDGGPDDQITFELDEWSDHDRVMLRDRFETLGVPHTWEGTTLVIASVDEAWVDRIIDQVEADLSTVSEDDDTQVIYDLTSWDDDSCVGLLDALAAEAIPYGLDGDELLVAGPDEERVDEIVEAITTPGATLAAGGSASFEAMDELFLAADQLAHDPDHRDGTAAVVRGARAAAGASAPYGTDKGWWDGVVARSGALADLVESTDPDGEQVVDLATTLRDDLRPYI